MAYEAKSKLIDAGSFELLNPCCLATFARKRMMKSSEFELFFSEHFGAAWPMLLERLAEEKTKVAISKDYAIDPSSELPAHLLAVQSHHRVGDLCAAPGGKTICLLNSGVQPENLVVGELSPARMARLRANIFDHLGEQRAAKVRFITGDSARWGQKAAARFDRLLVDVPCSGERYLVQAGKIHDWTRKRSQRMSVRQHAILCSAFDALVPGGELVYSTCSLSPFENDGVIAKLLKSRATQVRVEMIANLVKQTHSQFKNCFNETTHGILIRPDLGDQSYGPLFVAKITKLETT